MKIIEEILQTKINQLINYTVGTNMLVAFFAILGYTSNPDVSLSLMVIKLVYIPLLILFYLATGWTIVWKWFFHPDRSLREQPTFALSFVLIAEAFLVLLVTLAL